MHVTLKPNSFFEKNPSMDVPGIKDAKSVYAFSNGHANGHTNGTNGHTNGTTNGNSNGCCSD
jgi:primary-amine oxidase